MHRDASKAGTAGSNAASGAAKAEGDANENSATRVTGVLRGRHDKPRDGPQRVGGIAPTLRDEGEGDDVHHGDSSRT